MNDRGISTKEIPKPISKIFINNYVHEDVIADTINLRSFPLPDIPHGYVINDEIIYIKKTLERLTINIETVLNAMSEIAYDSGGENMSEEIKELKSTLSSIDKEVRNLTTNVAVLSERLDQKFINVDGRFNLVDVRFNNIDSSLQEIKDALKDSVTTKRWKVTTGIAIAGSIISFLSLILVSIKLFM